jgi:hypothetical protein
MAMHDLRLSHLRSMPTGDDEALSEDEMPFPHIPPEPVTETTAPAAVALRGAEMTVLDQSRAAIAHAWRVARRHSKDLADREGGMIHGLLRSQPPSPWGQHLYAASRAWVPPGHDNGIAEKAGVLYHLFIGRPGVTIFDALAGIFARPMRFAIAFGVACALTVITLYVLGYHGLAAGLVAGLGGALALGALALRLWPGRETGGNQMGDEDL